MLNDITCLIFGWLFLFVLTTMHMSGKNPSEIFFSETKGQMAIVMVCYIEDMFPIKF